MERVRRAAHAGSWYTDNAKKLDEDLGRWLLATGLPKSSNVRGVIAPHAGYSYSGRCAAFAFANIDPSSIERVFLLGPSHHYYTPRCALTRATIYNTPLGNLSVDLEVNEELNATGKFELMDIHVDEAEHSMEMHLPYLAKVFHGYPVKVVPILVGALSSENEAIYGQLLAKYVDDPINFFCVSSDFCHWGSRFSYTYYDKKQGPIYKSIEALDHMGMDIIETGDADAFKNYLKKYDNTICGRHPISVFIHVRPWFSDRNPKKSPSYLIKNGLFMRFLSLVHSHLNDVVDDNLPISLLLSLDVKELFHQDQDWLSAIRAIEPLQKHARQ